MAVAKKPRAPRSERAVFKGELEIPFQTRLLLELSKRHDVRVWRVNVGTVRRAEGGFFHAGPPKGAADVAGIIGPEGWSLQIECKAEGRKRTPEQIAWAEMVQALGAVYLLADARDGVPATLARLDALIAERRVATVRAALVGAGLAR